MWAVGSDRNKTRERNHLVKDTVSHDNGKNEGH